ncbi:glycosyl transferase family 90 [Roseovarius sp. EL26]|uniref:glycosyl transferase family 90 n=1 Tax=Roseovarius sp. EL26 TaxID=2126672 RepID=UPI0013C40E66|nr:glycosyl transferase family 90 [Roseovarius sp. EL26]
MRVVHFRSQEKNAPVIVTFPDLDWPLGFSQGGWALNFLNKRGAEVLAVQIKSALWYQDADFFHAMEQVKNYLPEGKKLTTYGSSMGGYGAILAARHLGAQRVVAACPQFSIDPAVVPFERRYNSYVEAVGEFRYDILKELDNSIEYFCLFDPSHTRDRRHVQRLAIPAKWHNVIIRGAGHAPLRTIVEAGAQDALYSLLTFHDNGVNLRNRFRERRQNSPYYVKRMGNLTASKIRTRHFHQLFRELAQQNGMWKMANRWAVNSDKLATQNPIPIAKTAQFMARRSKTNDDAFVEKSVRLMCGALRYPLTCGEAEMHYAFRASTGIAAMMTPTGDGPYRWNAETNDGPVMDTGVYDIHKTASCIEQIEQFSPKFPYIVDMQDRRVRSLKESGASGVFPVFSFNQVRTNRQRVLWPLNRYHDLGGNQYLDHVDPTAVPWKAKASKIIWRGGTTGHVVKPDGINRGLRYKRILRLYSSGELDKAAAMKHLLNVPRFNIVNAFQHSNFTDFGFVGNWGKTEDEDSLHYGMFKDPLSVSEQQKYRYIAVMPGQDVGSSLYWTLNSGSVAFVMETPFETFASGHFRPWEHYIPFAQNGGDLEGKFAWAEDNPDACLTMIQNAQSVCRLLARSDLRNRILSITIMRLNKIIAT